MSKGSSVIATLTTFPFVKFCINMKLFVNKFLVTSWAESVSVLQATSLFISSLIDPGTWSVCITITAACHHTHTRGAKSLSLIRPTLTSLISFCKSNDPEKK